MDKPSAHCRTLAQHHTQALSESYGGVKELIEVLLLFRHHPAEEVQQAITTAVKAGISASGGVRHLLHRNQSVSMIVPLERYARLPEADISVYARLGGGS